jgi:hypothetical protein
LGQKPLGPLILDHEQEIIVPSAINTYLREYQRDGVRFFWDQFKQGCGGLLGDDMGLVGFRFTCSCRTVLRMPPFVRIT